MTDSPKRSLYYKLAIVLIIAASCFRVFVSLVHNPMDYLWSDMLRHWNNGQHFPRGGYTGAADPIGYQVYVFLLQKITGYNQLLVGLSAALMSVLMPWTYYRAGRNFGLPKTAALWLWGLIAATPSLIVIYHFMMPETLLLLLEGIALWMTARYLRRGGTLAFLLFAFFWTLTCLTKPTLGPLAVVCFLWVWWKQRTPVRDIVIAAAMAFLMLLPQAIRSKAELGFYAPFGNPWLTRIELRCGARSIYFHFSAAHGVLRFSPTVGDTDFVYGSPSCFIRPLEPLSHWAMRRAWGDSKVNVLINSEHGEQDWKDAYDRYNHDPAEWFAQWRENIVLFLFAPSWPESGAGQWDGHLEYRARWIWAPLILVVFVCNIRQFLRRRFDLIPVAVTLFTLIMGLQNVIISEGRYRKPVEPLLLLNLVWVLGTELPTNSGEHSSSAPAEVSKASV